MKTRKKYVINTSTSIEFKQTDRLKKYIDFNTELRQNAKNEFEKDFFKLMNNSVYGKTMENVRKHGIIKLVKDNETRNKLVSQPNYHSCTCFLENLMAIEMKKTKVKFNKPIYVGMAILDKSKELMYKPYYNYLKPKYGDKVKLLYMDTDSFILRIHTKDFYKDISIDVNEWFDTRGYDKKLNLLLPIGINKKIVGTFKDEVNGKIIAKFCALRSKIYTFLIDGFNDEDYDKHDIVNKKPKGTKKCVVKKTFQMHDYKRALFNDGRILRTQQRFKSYNHDVYTETINKIALSSNNDKRVQIYDKIITHPH